MDAWARIPQLLVYGVVSGSILSLGGIGVSLTYSVLGFSNFAHGDIMALGAYLALALMPTASALGINGRPLGALSFGADFVVALLLAVVATCAVVLALDRILLRRLRNAGRITLMIASVGVALGLRSLIQFCWGPQPLYYSAKIQPARVIPGLGVRIKPDQVFILITAFALTVLLHLFLRHTRIGKAMRATADNAVLARVTGISAERVIVWTWILGASLAAVAGVLVGVENKLIVPELGWQLLLPIFAAVILGGLGNVYGAMVGGVVIGVCEEVSTAFVSTAYKPAVAFVLLILMLLVRPTGILGRRG